MRCHRNRRQATHLRIVADNGGDRLRRTGIGQVHQLCAGLERDGFHHEMRQRAVAD